MDTLTYQEAIENPDIQIMDKAAIGLAMEHKKPLIVFDLHKDGNILRAVSGEKIGTKVG